MCIKKTMGIGNVERVMLILKGRLIMSDSYYSRTSTPISTQLIFYSLVVTLKPLRNSV